MTVAALGRCVLADGRNAPAKFFWAANPGPGWAKRQFPVGHQLAKRRTERIAENGKLIRITRAFVPALPRDNPSLPEDYEDKLRASRPAIWCRRYLDGDWDAFEGQVFDEFDESIHTCPPRDFRKFDWTHLLTGDWGFRNPAAFLLVSMDYDGHWWVWREYRGLEMTPQRYAPMLRAMTEGVGLTAQLMDPAAVDQITGVTVRDQFVPLGFYFQGYAKRKHGPDGSLMFLKNLFRENRITICEDCAGLIKEIKEARWDDNTAAMEARRNQPEQMIAKDNHSIDALLGAVEWHRALPSEPRIGEEDSYRQGLELAREMERGNEWQREEIIRKRLGWAGDAPNNGSVLDKLW